MRLHRSQTIHTTREDSTQSIKQKQTELKEEINQTQLAIQEHNDALFWFDLAIKALIGTAIIFVISIILAFFISAFATISGILGVVLILFGPSIPIGMSFTMKDRIKERKEAKRQLRILLITQEQLAQTIFLQLPAMDRYYNYRLPNLVETYKKKANVHQKWFIWIQCAVIILSTSVVALSGGWFKLSPWLIPLLSGLVSILTGFTLFFKWREKGSNFQRTADAIDLEITACDLGIQHYKSLSRDEAKHKLAERVEVLRKEQQQREQQLEESIKENQNKAV